MNILVNMTIISSTTLLVRNLLPHVAKPARKTRAGKSNAAYAVALIVSGLPRCALVADDGLNHFAGYGAEHCNFGDSTVRNTDCHDVLYWLVLNESPLE